MIGYHHVGPLVFVDDIIIGVMVLFSGLSGLDSQYGPV